MSGNMRVVWTAPDTRVSCVRCGRLNVLFSIWHRKGANKKKNEIKTNGEWKREEKKVNTELINVYYIHI